MAAEYWLALAMKDKATKLINQRNIEYSAAPFLCRLFLFAEIHLTQFPSRKSNKHPTNNS